METSLEHGITHFLQLVTWPQRENVGTLLTLNTDTSLGLGYMVMLLISAWKSGSHRFACALSGHAIRSFLISLIIHTALLAMPLGGMRWGSDLVTIKSKTSGMQSNPLIVSLPLRSSAVTSSAKPITKLPAETSPNLIHSQTSIDTFESVSPEENNHPDSLHASLGIPIPPYLEQSEVSHQAQLQEPIDLDLAENTAQTKAGQMILNLYINELGQVDRVEIEESSINEQLANSFAHQFLQGIYQPASIGDVSVKSRLKIEILIRPSM